MREIKFRAWGRTGEWEEDGEAQKYEMCYDLAFEEFEPINDLLANVENLMQYIGLKDKNGKEIYEKDIFEFLNVSTKKKLRRVIEYCDRWACFWADGIPLSRTIKYSDEEWVAEIEVIGNIYENPELLKQKQQKKHYGIKKGEEMKKRVVAKAQKRTKRNKAKNNERIKG